MAMWLTVPIDHPPNGVEDGQQQQQQGTGAPGPFGSVAADPWETWNQFRSLCAHDTLLGCVLKLGPQLLPLPPLQRWLYEPLSVREQLSKSLPTQVAGKLEFPCLLMQRWLVEPVRAQTAEQEPTGSTATPAAAAALVSRARQSHSAAHPRLHHQQKGLPGAAQAPPGAAEHDVQHVRTGEGPALSLEQLLGALASHMPCVGEPWCAWLGGHHACMEEMSVFWLMFLGMAEGKLQLLP
eukprot:scaffold13132_cov16-Tisochrysis_lutea.AAC.1